MANTTLTVTNASVRGSLTGVNVDSMVYFDWDVKSLASGVLAAEWIETPSVDLNALAPKCNRIVLQKSLNAASADTMTLLVSPNGTNWYHAPLFNGGTGGGNANGAPNAAEVSIVGLPTMRYVKGRVALATAMSSLTSARIALSLMRF